MDHLPTYEPLEALRVLDYLAPRRTLLVNKYRLPPMLVSAGKAACPSKEQVECVLKESSERLILFNVTQKGELIGRVKAMNMLLLGAPLLAAGCGGGSMAEEDPKRCAPEVTGP